jgi:hypothetical protein
MKMLQLTPDRFDAAVADATCLVIEFSDSAADFAGRVGAAVAPDFVSFGHVDLRTERQLAQMFGIDADAALLIFREQIVLYLEAGRHDAARITGLLSRVLALDMPTVRAEIEAQKQAELALRMRRVCPTARRRPIGE